MPNAAEIIEKLAGELEIYRIFARVQGCPTKEDVMKVVASLVMPEQEDDQTSSSQ